MTATNPRPVETSPQPVRPRVLIADDSRVIRLAIKKILGADYDLIEVGDGAMAWDRIREDGDIKALITDIEMPNVDGYELICRIRGAENSRLRELPVITITGAEDDATKQRAFACGATDFIVKPIDAIQLRARVQAYVRYDQNNRELVEKTAVLEDQAIMDSTTGLCSRRYLLQRGEQDVAFSVRRDKDLSLIHIDIDHFRKLYKTHGDDVSEGLLVWFGKLLLSSARTEDTAARIGGTEFAILASATALADANVLCQRLNESVANQPYRHGNLTVPITLSMGMASLVQDRQTDIEGLLKLAQQRLCHAQSEGGDRVCSSILGEALAVDEVHAAGIETEMDSLPSLPETALESVPADTLTVAELEGLLRQEEGVCEPIDARSAVVSFPAPPARDLSAMPLALILPMMPGDLLSVDKALYLLGQGRADVLAPYLEELMRQIQPLMDLSSQVKADKTE